MIPIDTNDDRFSWDQHDTMLFEIHGPLKSDFGPWKSGEFKRFQIDYEDSKLYDLDTEKIYLLSLIVGDEIPNA